MSEIDPQVWPRINELAKTIHKSELNDLVRSTIEQLRDIVGFSYSMYHFSMLANDAIASFNYGSLDLPQEHIERYRTEYEPTDYINWFADEVVPRVFRDTDIIPERVREQSRIMTGWFAPYGIYFSAGMTIASETHPYGNIYLFRTREEGDFTDSEMAALEAVNEHLCIRYEREYPDGFPEYQATSDLTTPFSRQHRLTRRESTIIACIQEGSLRKDLPSLLCISENTLKKHLANIYKKMHINHYEELLQLIQDEGK